MNKKKLFLKELREEDLKRLKKAYNKGVENCIKIIKIEKTLYGAYRYGLTKKLKELLLK